MAKNNSNIRDFYENAVNGLDTLFLVTSEGDRHEDHIPEFIWPLNKIKKYITNESYKDLLMAKNEWVTGVNWFDRQNVKPQYKKQLEDIRTGKNTNEKDFDNFLGDGIYVMNFYPIVLKNGCMKFNYS